MTNKYSATGILDMDGCAYRESPCHGLCFHGVWVWWLGIWTHGLQRMGCCAGEGACVTRSSAVDEAWNGGVAMGFGV